MLLSVAYRVCGWGWNRFCTPGYPLAATVGPLSRFEDWQPRSKKLFHPRCCTALWISTPSGYFLRPAMLPSLSLSLDRTGQLSPSLSLSLSLSIYLSISLLFHRVDTTSALVNPPVRAVSDVWETGLSRSSYERVFYFRVSFLFFYREGYYLFPAFLFSSGWSGCFLLKMSFLFRWRRKMAWVMRREIYYL